MSNPDQTEKPDDASPSAHVPREPLSTGPMPTRSARPAREPGRRGGGTLALALLLALMAVGAAGYVGWQQWQQQQRDAVGSQGVASLQQRVGALETSLSALTTARAGVDQRIEDAAQVNRSLREELLGQAERTRHLEDAVAKLAEKSLSGKATLRLDEAETLLRMASERYTLFHDARGAAAAYALADQTLAAVNDSTFSGVRQSINAEREALVRSQPVGQMGALQQLSDLRGALAELPLKPIDQADITTSPDAWSRIGRALAGVVSVQRDNGAPLAVADARLARELLALDLAQAQAALLAYDSKAYAAALQRADTALATQFDGTAPVVESTRGSLQALAAQLPKKPSVQLGAALTELRNLRTLHALSPVDEGVAPAAASSTVVPVGGDNP